MGSGQAFDPMPKAWVYILKWSDGSYYAGSTTDLQNRLAEHQAGEGSDWTKRRLPVHLVFSQEMPNDQAYIAEQQKEIEQPKAYLFRIAKNLALTQLTRKSEKITDYLEECGASVVIESGAAADSEVEAEESLGLYCEALAALPEKCRQVFLLRKVHGLAHKEIAERMSLSVSSVEKYLFRGVLDCKAFVQERECRVPNREASTAAESGRNMGRQ